MPEVSVKDQIKKLVELQTLDSEIYNFNKELKEKPANLEELKNQFEQKKAKLNVLEEQHKALIVDRKSQETELKAKEEEIVKANAQLSDIKNNKEYQAKITEIGHHKADMSVIEEKILVSYDEAEKINAEIEKEKQVLAEEEKHYLAQKKEVDDSVKEIKDKVAVLEGKRKHVLPDVDADSLSYYEKVLEKKEGIAIAPVHGSSCGGCFMNVTPQMINEIKKHEKLVSCEMCNRILYIEEDL